MFKRMAAILIVGIFAISFVGPVFSQEASAGKQAEKTEDVGNKICPVTGEKINEATKATYEYQGKIYNFCCPVCIDEFKKDPEKFIKKVEEEKQEEQSEEKGQMHH